MATYFYPHDEAGMASSETETFATVELFSGEAPITTTTETLLDQNADLPAFSVVGRITASGKITLCNPAAVDGSQDAIGITTAKVADNGADNEVGVFRGGMFNPAALNWHAGFDSDLKKRVAFEAKQPTIFIQSRRTF